MVLNSGAGGRSREAVVTSDVVDQHDPARSHDAAACSISNSVFLKVWRLSWMNSSTFPTSVTSGGIRRLLSPST